MIGLQVGAVLSRSSARSAAAGGAPPRGKVHALGPGPALLYVLEGGI